MKLYDGGRAPNPRRVQIFLNEKSIEIERVQIDLNQLEQKSDTFSKINPLNTVPVLELDDGSFISESVAICRYFEMIQPEPALMGVGAVEAATIEMWQRRIEFNLFLPVAMAFRHLHPGAKVLENEQIEAWGKLNQGRVEKTMAWLDEELKNREFIAGDQFTIADITALTAMQFLKPARVSLNEHHTNLIRWFEAVAARPSAAL